MRSLTYRGDGKLNFRISKISKFLGFILELYWFVLQKLQKLNSKNYDFAIIKNNLVKNFL